MPAPAMFEALGRRRKNVRLDELRLLKRHFGVSMQALAVRAADLGIIDGSLKKKIFMAFSRLGWRKAEPDALPLEQPTLWRQLVSRALAEGVLGSDAAHRWGYVEDEVGDASELKPERDARTLLTLPEDQRSEILRSQAENAQDLYAPGSELIEWTERFVEDDIGVRS